MKEIHTRPAGKMVTLRRVQEILRPYRSRSEDSQRLLEIYEIVLETLGIVRQLQAKYDKLKSPGRARQAEKEIRERVNSRQPQSNPAVKPPII